MRERRIATTAIYLIPATRPSGLTDQEAVGRATVYELQETGRAVLTVRAARADELPYLQARLNESKHEKVDLARTILHVAEEDGKVIGILPARMWWQLEPMFIFPEVKNKTTRQRACFNLAKAAQQWIGDRSKNHSGVYSYWFVTKSRLFAKLAKKWGCYRIYKNTQMFGKDC